MSTRGWEHATPTDVRHRRVVIAKPSKYHAEKVTVDAIRFDSKAEAKRYGELKALEKAGQISQLELQPRFDLHVAGIRIGGYVGDFRYVAFGDLRFTEIVEDVKGMDTPLSKWKRKHVLAEYGVIVRLVK